MTISVLGPKSITPELVLSDCHEIKKKSLVCIGLTDEGEAFFLSSHMQLRDLAFLEKYFSMELQKMIENHTQRADGRSQ